MDGSNIALRVALRHTTAGALEDVSKLRFQAVFLMGAGGSGKGFVGRKWMKYMPGGGSSGIDFDKQKELAKRRLTEMERGQSNLSFESAVQALKNKYNLRLEAVPGGKGKIPFVLYTYDGEGREIQLKPEDWKKELSPEIFSAVEGIKDVVFAAPKHEIPSFWRQVDPDLYKKELAGYSDKQPGYVHEMSSSMAKAYFEAVLESGDPLFVDGTGTNPKKMAQYLAEAKAAGYKTSLVFVAVPLVVNQIRNATRKRNVNPNIVTGQWRVIPKVYDQIKGMADKAKVIVNRADSMDVAAYRANADAINTLVRENTAFDNLYELIQKEAPNELRDWGKVLKLDTGEAEREQRFKRLEEKRQERGLKPRQYVLAKKEGEHELAHAARVFQATDGDDLEFAARDFQAHIDKTAAVVTVRDKCMVTLLITKIQPYGKTQEMGDGSALHHHLLIGHVDHKPSFGVPVQFKAHVIIFEDSDGDLSLDAIHVEGSGKVVPKVFGPYVQTLLRQYYGSWIGSIPV